MEAETKVKSQVVDTKPFHLRKLTRAGSARYLGVGTILPKDWEAVKVYVEDMSASQCILRIVPIR